MGDAMREAWGNPSSIHGHGRDASKRVEHARMRVAELTGVLPEEVVFTSGATEALHLAIVAMAKVAAGGWIVSSKLEHPAVLRALERMEREGRARVAWLAIDGEGRVALESVAAITQGQPIAGFCVQQLNNETGVLQPLADIFRLAREHRAAVVVDTAQSVGRIAEHWPEADARVVAAHKIGGPKGIGALIAKRGFRVEALLGGGEQERGLRPGTSDAALSAGFGVAALHAMHSPAKYAALAPLRDAFEQQLLSIAPGACAIGCGARRAPHVSNIAFYGWQAPELVAALDLEGVRVSAGSACSAGTVKVSPVISAIVGEERARGAVRFSLGLGTTAEELDRAAAVVRRIISR